MKAVRVHAVQYALTGLALAMFFLLFLSLSEHIGFGRAYLVAATACVALVAVYMAGVLGSLRRGLFFAALLAGLYGLLYGVLQSEDYALLMGTLALFALRATVMLITRRFDWYAATADRPLPPNAPVPPLSPR
ncbi:MAG TPA: inner membrane CreD family protein [Xanthomonadaceae bacterium]|nr:inner membrane CreD family protein [Xanthomonadaceae bacterium]